MHELPKKEFYISKMMGTQRQKTKKSPLASTTTQEQDTQNKSSSSSLAEALKRNQILTSLVSSLRAQLISNDSNELHEQNKDLKSQLKELRNNYEESKSLSQSLSLELFEAVEYLEKNFHIQGQEGNLKSRIERACSLHQQETKEALDTIHKENQDKLLDVEKILLVKVKDPHRVFNGHWVPDNIISCCSFEGCPVRFGLWNRRHHCRKCGLIFCAGHSQKKMNLGIIERKACSNHDNGLNVRVCDDCFE